MKLSDSINLRLLFHPFAPLPLLCPHNFRCFYFALVRYDWLPVRICLFLLVYFVCDLFGCIHFAPGKLRGGNGNGTMNATITHCLINCFLSWYNKLVNGIKLNRLGWEFNETERKSGSSDKGLRRRKTGMRVLKRRQYVTVNGRQE